MAEAINKSGEEAAQRLYLASQDDSIHCNRYPSWGELGESERQIWRDKLAATPNEKAPMGEGRCPFPDCVCPPDSEGDVHCRLTEQMRAEFWAWVDEQGCDTDGAWSAWQAASAGKAELVEALQNLLAVHEGEGGTKYHAGDIARAALAKHKAAS